MKIDTSRRQTVPIANTKYIVKVLPNGLQALGYDVSIAISIAKHIHFLELESNVTQAPSMLDVLILSYRSFSPSRLYYSSTAAADSTSFIIRLRKEQQITISNSVATTIVDLQ